MEIHVFRWLSPLWELFHSNNRCQDCQKNSLGGGRGIHTGRNVGVNFGLKEFPTLSLSPHSQLFDFQVRYFSLVTFLHTLQAVRSVLIPRCHG
jgi:hypothetical protein